MVGVVLVFILVEGGINLENVKVFKNIGVNILVVGIVIDNVVCNVVKDVVLWFIIYWWYGVN